MLPVEGKGDDLKYCMRVVASTSEQYGLSVWFPIPVMEVLN